MCLRSTLLAALATLAVIVPAAPASAHEVIEPKTVPTGQTAFLTLTAANEASVDLVRIVLRAPAGLDFGKATRSPAGWSAAVAADTITWTGGALKPRTFDTWGFEIEGADQPATLTYNVTVGYAGGKTDNHDVDITAVPPGAGGTGTADPTATTSTTAVTETAATSPTTAAAPVGSDGDSGTATAALVISIVALLLAGGGLVGARRRGGPAANRTSGEGTAAGAAQDW